MSLTLHPGAKLNLGLRIIGARDDGFHEIVSVFQEISLRDRLLMEVHGGSGNISLTCGDGLPDGSGNIVWRAARKFLDISGERIDVRMELSKRIPVEAGLGGGSSDAASVLKCLAEVTGRLDLDLVSASADLGSDVPFFLAGGTALVRGRGELLTPMPTIPFHAVLVHPPVTVPTPEAYRLWDAEAPGPSDGSSYLTNSDMIRHDSASSAVWHEGKPFPLDLRNDFLPLLEKRIPEIAEVSRFLSDSLSCDWGLSGSGPTFFALFRTEEEACCFSRRLRWNFSICRTADTAGASSNG